MAALETEGTQLKQLEHAMLGKEYQARVRPLPPPILWLGLACVLTVASSGDAIVDAPDVRIHPTPSPADPDPTHQSETTIAISPLNNEVVLGSANTSAAPHPPSFGYGYYYSIDAGTSWVGDDQFPPVGDATRTDPTTAIDRLGYFHIAGLGTLAGVVVLKRSHDGGTNWESFRVTPIAPLPGLDKTHLTVDNSLLSPHQGQLYAGWSYAANLYVEVTRSLDTLMTERGELWFDRTNISDGLNWGPGHGGVNIQTGPNGDVYACWAVETDPSSTRVEVGIGFAKSTTGARTWKPPTFARAPFTIKGMRAYSGWPGLGFRTNSFPVMAVDQHTGRIYIAWINQGPPGVNVGDPDVYLIYSDDGGVSWSAALPVNNPNDSDAVQFHCWIATDPLVPNHVYAAYYDNSLDPNSNICQFVVAHSTNGGSTFTEQVVSDSPFEAEPLSGLPLYNGDYPGIAARGGRVYPFWHAQLPGSNAQGWVSPCVLDDLELEQATLVAGEKAQYDAAQRISAGGAGPVVVASGAEVDFEAGSEIRLTATASGGTFTAAQGSELHASIEVFSKAGVLVSHSMEVTRDGGKTRPVLSSVPNPFNPVTTIAYALERRGSVSLKVFDVRGRLVRTLLDAETQTAGLHRAVFDGTMLPSGVYFATLRAGGAEHRRRLILLK
jgi:hypothetical protein